MSLTREAKAKEAYLSAISKSPAKEVYEKVGHVVSDTGVTYPRREDPYGEEETTFVEAYVELVYRVGHHAIKAGVTL